LKQLILASALLLIAAASAQAEQSKIGLNLTLEQMLGNFSEPTSTFVVGYETEEACTTDKGQWIDEMCIFDAENTLVVSQQEKQVILSMETIGSNAHICSFEGPAEKISETELQSKVASDVWDGSDWVPGFCTVTASYSDTNTVQVSSAGCEMFCGARAQLYIDSAKRK